MKLSPRLKKIVSLLELPTSIVDIGTDHAYIPIHLAKNTNCSKIIASDCNRAPYQAALEHVRQADVEDKVDVRLGCGLSVLSKSEVQTAIIAGMGGQTIRQIIGDDYDLAQGLDRIVLQPMAGAGSLRKWLVNNNFKIINEALVADNDKFYQIIVVTPGSMKLEDSFLLEIGPQLIEKGDPLLSTYLDNLEEKWQKIIKDIAVELPDHPKVINLKSKIDKMQEVKKCLSSYTK
ncbi:putative SAM-dependent methyltransferase [Halobacteroides halobius DSM 5150]|uniref:Putative SAM-dependent methyltransferase n=1 Tax=Halobacteroides halobius (strain ATCC 35273 / DSM 5150 / MD-1) TaxID=748449 RepID=L0KB82_HALHC|nr:class I SAM-dependent methyltransferase [Halobacteroides halobius]AGB41780.1 putative SAM-dependent methyltransferase [Halobacteroides halobius DSM 5150]